MKGMYRPPRGARPNYVNVVLRGWEHAKSIVVMDADKGPSFSGTMSAIKARQGCGSDYEWEEINPDMLVIVIAVPGKRSRVLIQYDGCEHADVIWIHGKKPERPKAPGRDYGATN